MTMDTKLVRVAAPLRAQVEEALRRAIADGDLAPGTRLVERELCEEFAVSRPLLREALRQLEAERLVQTIPNRGMVVFAPTLQDALQLFQVRAELEGLASRIVAERGTIKDHKQLAAHLAALKKALMSGNRKMLQACKNEFYAKLILASGNEVLAQILSGLHNRIQLFRGAALAEPGRAENAVAELEAVLRAIEAKDGRQAQILTIRHLQNAAYALAQALARADNRTLTNDELAAITTAPGFQMDT
jgi:DNA-binding GntR family transcriptional regulator